MMMNERTAFQASEQKKMPKAYEVRVRQYVILGGAFFSYFFFYLFLSLLTTQLVLSSKTNKNGQIKQSSIGISLHLVYSIKLGPVISGCLIRSNEGKDKRVSSQ